MQKPEYFFHCFLLRQYSTLLFVSLASLCLSLSCQVQPYVTMPAYEELIVGRSLIIAALQSANIQASDEVEKIFGEKATDSLYISFFEDNFTNILGRVSSFANVTQSSDKLAELRAMEVIIPGNDTTYFYLPDNNKILSFKKDKTADFILFLSGLVLAPSWIDVEFDQRPNIRHTIYYLFWDNQKHKIVCYGKTSYTASVKNDKQDYRLLINNLAKSLIENTPFRKIQNHW
jgi:hypothetical protein